MMPTGSRTPSSRRRERGGQPAPLAACMAAQTPAPRGLADRRQRLRPTTTVADRSTSSRASTPWIDRPTLRGPGDCDAGGPIVRAFDAGLARARRELPDVVVKLDADVSFDPDYFERAARRVRGRPALGIASGTCYEQERRRVASRYYGPVTRLGRHARVPARVPRGGPAARGAHGLGRHRRAQGAAQRLADAHAARRCRSATTAPRASATAAAGRWLDQGDAAHYMGYRFWYLLARALFNARREPAALAMVEGYSGAALTPRARATRIRAGA